MHVPVAGVRYDGPSLSHDVVIVRLMHALAEQRQGTNFCHPISPHVKGKETTSRNNSRTKEITNWNKPEYD
jgi:hypothetical protein